MPSPYPWHYTLRWLWYYLHPSTTVHDPLPPAPLEGSIGQGPPLAPGEPAVTVAFFGDLMCAHGDRVPVIDPALTAVLSRADRVIGNLEAPLLFERSRPDARYFGHFAMSAEFLAAFLERLGVTPDRAVLSIANNHVADQGQDGIDRTVDHLGRLGVAIAGKSEPGSPPLVVFDTGAPSVSIGVAAWTHWINSERLRATEAIGRTHQVEATDWARVRRERAIDGLIGFPHWEYEFQHFPSKATRALARRLVEGGFDLIVGHHPHVLQPLEVIGDGLCLYSLGNLNGPEGRRGGLAIALRALLEVTLRASGPARGRPAAYRLHPFAQWRRDDGVLELGALERTPEAVRALLRERLSLLYPGPGC